MLSLKHRSPQKELLDQDTIPFEDIRQNMIELNTVNTLLGGHTITLDGVRSFLNKNEKALHIAEIGSGGGDNLFVIGQFLKKKNIAFKLTGIDIKKECTDYASNQFPSIDFICSDYKDVLFEKKPDIIFNSLFCHHFTNDELIGVLQWMKKNSVRGFFINDLERNFLAYYSIKILTAIFSKSYLVKHDAPLSVARSFRRSDWEKILEEAGITNCEIKWKWAFRYLIRVKNN